MLEPREGKAVNDVYPDRFRLLGIIAFRGGIVGLLFGVLWARLTRPDFYEPAPDVCVLALLPLIAGAAAALVPALQRLFRNTPSLAISNMEVFIDCSILGPTIVRWDDVENVRRRRTLLTDSIEIVLTERGVERLDFWRRLALTFGLGGSANSLRIPASMLPGGVDAIGSELGHIFRQRGTLLG